MCTAHTAALGPFSLKMWTDHTNLQKVQCVLECSIWDRILFLRSRAAGHGSFTITPGKCNFIGISTPGWAFFTPNKLPHQPNYQSEQLITLLSDLGLGSPGSSDKWFMFVQSFCQFVKLLEQNCLVAMAVGTPCHLSDWLADMCITARFPELLGTCLVSWKHYFDV